MARSISPGGYSNYEDDSLFQSAAFTHDISEQMRVPKRIRATGDYFDDHERDLLPNGNGEINSWNYHNKIDMTVPDRIVVLGQDQHLGTKSAPREIMLENSILPKDPGFVRVSTPPRVITLNEHHFPSASDEPEENAKDLEQQDDYGPASLESLEDPNNSQVFYSRPLASHAGHSREPTAKRSAFSKYNNELTLTRSMREETPTFGGSVENLTPSEEVTHLRRQVAKINRRLLAIELESVSRQQREKVIYCVGMAYLLFKTFMWLSRK